MGEKLYVQLNDCLMKNCDMLYLSKDENTSKKRELNVH